MPRRPIFGHFLQAIEHKLDAGGNAELVEDVEQIISNDSGSTTLGFALACLSLDFFRAHAGAPASLLFPPIAAALPLLDALIVIARRISQRRSPLFGDRRHGYDELAAQGRTPRNVATIVYALASCSATIALFTVRGSSAFARMAFAVASVALMMIAAGHPRIKEATGTAGVPGQDAGVEVIIEPDKS